ncbi:M1 family metallopeptidase [Alkaliphilus oremlandii]|uniref:Peptidase M1 membrane alanine aminopeptidase n=1 Tax=Alkaliphilus oremlandii (strain OhILAs) TaxID=350688 RepID=A8MKJ2_ALKOO|nr:M1 family metallopeptidase [Alkaliphilus oremlandii]ABW20324.1 Peptidase M1 membrane alanine aminopeptidase [Alkaliphilus oremlandii OhILAs]
MYQIKLRKKLYLWGIVLVVFLIPVVLNFIWNTGQVQRVFNTVTQHKEIAEYTINAVFSKEDRIIRGQQHTSYENTSDNEVESIYFHLYPNAFKDSKTAPFQRGDMVRAYPNGFDKGWIKIHSVVEGKNKVDYRIMGKGDTNLRVTPKEPIKPGERIALTIDFEVKLPNAVGRMGYGENTVNIANWYPILSVFDKNGWNLEPYYAIGDPFYSKTAEYSVNFTIPEEYKLATTGNIIKVSDGNKSKTYKINANNVRDFAIVLSENFTVSKGLVEDIEVLSYTIGGQKKEEALKYGMDSLAIFNQLFGKYPYEQLSIVASDFFIGGMEYPNIVLISQELYEVKENFPLEYVIAHEVAHQWWYGIVGNNEITEPWLDEALTEYATLLYFEEKYGDTVKDEVYDKMIKKQYEALGKARKGKEDHILRSLKEFEDALEYSSIVYSKGAMFLEELRQQMGDESFIKAMREYYEAFQFKNATTEDFYNVVQKNSTSDLKDLFSEWLNK